jgi:hypothetical protein
MIAMRMNACPIFQASSAHSGLSVLSAYAGETGTAAAGYDDRTQSGGACLGKAQR